MLVVAVKSVGGLAIRIMFPYLSSYACEASCMT